MPNIKKIDVSSLTIKGLHVRTNNANEIDRETQKIAPLWERFYDEVLPTLQEGATVYGVYHNYESDANGAYDVTVGTDTLELTEHMQEVTIEEGRYLVFPIKGEFPKAIIEGWKQVWAYVEDPSIDERRAYETDFERYISEDEAQIVIGVHYF